MNIFQKMSTSIRNAWLTGVSAKKNTTKAIDKVTEGVEGHFEELAAEGATMEGELTEKLKLRARLDRRISALNNVLGTTNSSNDDKLILMSDKVDQVTIVVNALIEKKQAEKKALKKPRKSAAKKSVKSAALPSTAQVSA